MNQDNINLIIKNPRGYKVVLDHGQLFFNSVTKLSMYLIDKDIYRRA